MTENFGSPNYQGYLNNNCAIIAGMLRSDGYCILMSGEWHVGADYSDPDINSWSAGDTEHPVPIQRGFDRYFGLLGGAGSFFNPPELMLGERFMQIIEGGAWSREKRIIIEHEGNRAVARR